MKEDFPNVEGGLHLEVAAYDVGGGGLCGTGVDLLIQLYSKININAAVRILVNIV